MKINYGIKQERSALGKYGKYFLKNIIIWKKTIKLHLNIILSINNKREVPVKNWIQTPWNQLRGTTQKHKIQTLMLTVSHR